MGTCIKVCVLFLLLGVLTRSTGEEDDEVGIDELGGVSIKVFRGPSKTRGQETFAPFGYHVKMPAVGPHQKKTEGDSDEPDDDNDSSKQGGEEEDFDFPNDDEED
ncbi:uncharacterized protein LOC129983628 [Argiope bruennichi]|uniref:Uncharacterized protein n=1 Tax=Argiope bruennichi TaxID=94029 RepID=A0A8T0ER81_ARGBR|nr:uncharacterized protein LOC129983628 [Argiope bruennichi]KAF8774699.1 hypothetical protein HNY73_017223 [Argiope bruennichi]